MIYSLFDRLLGLKGPECPKKSIYPRGWPLQTPQQKRRAVLSSGNKLAENFYQYFSLNPKEMRIPREIQII